MMRKKLSLSGFHSYYEQFKSVVSDIASGKSLAINYTQVQEIARQVKATGRSSMAEYQECLVLQLGKLSLEFEADRIPEVLWENDAFLRCFLSSADLYSPIEYPSDEEDLYSVLSASEASDEVTPKQLRDAVSLADFTIENLATFLGLLQRYRLLNSIESFVVTDMDSLTSQFQSSFSSLANASSSSEPYKRKPGEERSVNYKYFGKTKEASHQARLKADKERRKKAREANFLERNPRNLDDESA